MPATSSPARDTDREVLISTRGLTRRYGDVTAVDHLDLDLYAGEVFGLLGPNGAGKTTTILMLLGLSEPSEGTATVGGLDPVRAPIEVKRLVGYLPDNVGFYGNLTGRENLRFTAQLNRMSGRQAEEHIEQILSLVGLSESADRPVETYSRGMRQRLGIADVLVKRPRIIVLDEPTLGIDPEGTREVLSLIRRLSREQKITVLLSSHLLYQVQTICDRVGIFVRGKMIAQGPVHELEERLLGAGSLEIEVATASLEQARAALSGLGGISHVDVGPEHLVLTCASDLRAQISGALVEKGLTPTHLRLRERGLEEIYRRYFQEGGGAVDKHRV